MPDEAIITVALPARRAYSLSERSLNEQKPEERFKVPPEWVVYAIQNCTDRIYIGQTGDLHRRITAPNTGLVRSTKNGCPWRVVAVEKCGSRSAARWIEFRLKRSRGRRIKWLQQYGCGVDE